MTPILLSLNIKKNWRQISGCHMVIGRANNDLYPIIYTKNSTSLHFFLNFFYDFYII